MSSPISVDTPDLAVVGAGVIGMTIAWRAAVAGLTVEIYERESRPATGASAVAAGMLAPISEAEVLAPELLAANLASAGRWEAFAQQLSASGDEQVELRKTGTLLVARDEAEAAWLQREFDLRLRLGLDVERMLGSAARKLEPSLDPSLRLAIQVADDHAVEPARVNAALRAALARTHIPIHYRRKIDDPRALPGRHVVVAAGPWSGDLAGQALAAVPVRPVKGQALRLRDRRGAGLIERVIRWGVPRSGYLVPRGDGRYYLGATVEERGFDTGIGAGSVHDLLRDAAEIVPDIRELEIDELIVGLRPGTPNNVPIIGPDRHDRRVIWATGHFRNGILLAPLTAELVLAVIGAAPWPEDLALSADTFARRDDGSEGNWSKQ